MKCLLCKKLSLKIICKSCNNDIKIVPKKRILLDGLSVYSFFDYDNIEYLLKSKYSLIGSKIFKILALKASLYFKNNIADFSEVYAIGIDDKVESYYSHSGVIVKQFSNIFKPLYGTLKASNNIHYAGKSLEFRQQNKKGFIYSGKSNINVVLLDDIITTGESLKEAREVLQKNGVNVLFALTLSDANC